MNWIDKDWDGGTVFIKNKTDMKNDTNKDGIVDWKEACDATTKEADKYWTGFLKKFVEEEYEGGSPRAASRMSIKPKIKVGKRFKKANLK